MPPILGVNFESTKLVKFALESFFGVGPQVSAKIMARNFIYPYATIGSLPNTMLATLTNQLSEMKIENDLKKEIRENIKRLKDINSYRGRRHAMGLPVRGQNTRSQINTAKALNKVDRRL